LKKESVKIIAVKRSDNERNDFFVANDLIEFKSGSLVNIDFTKIDRNKSKTYFFDKKKVLGKSNGSAIVKTSLLPFVYNKVFDNVNNELFYSVFGERQIPGISSGGILNANKYPRIEYEIESDTIESINKKVQLLDYVAFNVKTEVWTFEYLGDKKWSVYGSESGWKHNAITGKDYFNEIIKVLISDEFEYNVGDYFTINITSNVACQIYEVQAGELGSAFLYKPSMKCSELPKVDLLMGYYCGDDTCAIELKKAVVSKFTMLFDVNNTPELIFELKSPEYIFHKNEFLREPFREVFLTEIYQQYGCFNISGENYNVERFQFVLENKLKEINTINSKNGIKDFEVVDKIGYGEFVTDIKCFDLIKEALSNDFKASLYYSISSEVLVGHYKQEGTEKIKDIFGDGSCVGLFRFEENLNDEEEVYLGEWINEEYPGYYEKGYLHKAVVLEGYSGVKTNVPIPNSDFSVSGWFYLNGYERLILSNYEEQNGLGLGMHPNGKIYVYIVKNGNYIYLDGQTISDKKYNLQEWLFYTLIFYKEEKYVEVYVNSEKVLWGYLPDIDLTDKIFKIGNLARKL